MTLHQRKSGRRCEAVRSSSDCTLDFRAKRKPGSELSLGSGLVDFERAALGSFVRFPGLFYLSPAARCRRASRNLKERVLPPL
jgi:hypothetical protein